MTTTKPKIQKTNRIRLKFGTIYCSSKIVSMVRDHCIRLNQVMVPKKDHLPDLERQLYDLAIEHPDHFPHSSKVQLGAV